MPPTTVRRDRERGAASVEYAGVVVAVVVLVAALLVGVSRFGVAERIGCAIRSIGTQAGACGSDDTPTVYEAEGADGDGDGGGDVRAPGPAGSGEAGDGTDDAETADGADSADADSADADYRNASDDRPAADEESVEEALDEIRDALDGGFWGVRGGDLEDAKDVIEGLNGAEIDALIAEMSDEELEAWVDQLEDGWIQGGWDRDQRRQLWEVFAAKASRTTLDRLAGLTDELEPGFGDVGGDDARENPESPANSGEYGEIPHQLVVDGIEPGDVSQGQIGDCWYIASLMAVAQADPSVIEDAITANDNGTYTVRLYDDGQEIEVTVTPEMVLDDGNPAFVRTPDGEDGYELWPMVLEKALALHWGDFSAIEGDSPGLGLELLTGRSSDQRSLDDAGGVDSLAGYLADGGAVTLATFTESDDNPDIYDEDPSSGGLASNHAYYVSAVDVENGTVTVTNPWGAGWPTVTMTYGEFEDSFSSIYFNEVA